MRDLASAAMMQGTTRPDVRPDPAGVIDTFKHLQPNAASAHEPACSASGKRSGRAGTRGDRPDEPGAEPRPKEAVCVMNNFVPRSALAIFDLPESHRQGYPPDADVPLSISLPDDCRRVLMISRPGLVSDCLLRMLNAFGLETAQQSLGDPLNDQFDTVALAILWISHVDADILAAARQRVEELRTRLPQVRVMALVDGIERAAIPELSMLGITAIVVGSPSIRVAVAAIQFVMVGGPLVNAEIH
ncbi:MAG: response regulator transcription factor, partial [Rhizobiales bacterium]|nr:response regulator transcription factor [Hyphomicrobiales bacterium]